jgi:hypothetical protein
MEYDDYGMVAYRMLFFIFFLYRFINNANKINIQKRKRLGHFEKKVCQWRVIYAEYEERKLEAS